MAENVVHDGVAPVGIVGEDCAKIENIIDELIVGNSNDEPRFILTSLHPEETVYDAVGFATSLMLGPEGEPQVVVLSLFGRH